MTWNHASNPCLFSWFPGLSKLHLFFSWSTFSPLHVSCISRCIQEAERAAKHLRTYFYQLERDIWCCGSMQRGLGGVRQPFLRLSVFMSNFIHVRISVKMNEFILVSNFRCSVVNLVSEWGAHRIFWAIGTFASCFAACNFLSCSVK